MGKHKHIKTHHLYLGAGGVVAVVALVVALTFGLSSAQDFSGSGSYTPPPATTPPPSGDTGSYTPPPATTTPPPAGDTGTYVPPSGTTYTPPPTNTGVPPPSCPSGQWWDFATSTCKSSNMGGTGTYMPPPSGGLNCTGGQFPCYSENTCKPTGSSCNDSAMGGGQYPPPSGSMPPPATQPGMNQYPSAQACTSGQVMCPSLNNTCASPEACGAATPVCGPNEYPTAQKPCKPSSTMPTQPTTGGDCWNSSSANFASQECTQMRASVNDAKAQQPQNSCPAGEHRDWSNNCVKDLQPQDQPQWQQPKPGECPQEMQTCPDQWNPSNTVCMPKKMFWDSKTGKNIPEGKLATCDDFKSPTTTGPGSGMGGFGMGGGFGGQGMGGFGPMPFGGQDTQGGNPCEFNPNDPFCKGGFDFGAMKDQWQDQYKFDESEFQPQEYKMNASDIKREVKSLKMDVKNWMGDVKQVNSQLKEIGRESSGFACPAAAEVSSILQEYQNAIDTVSALNENSSQEEIQRARALGDFIRGKWQDGEQVTEGLQQKLYGGPMDEDGNRKPGKMESLNVCRELSNAIREANSWLKQLTSERKGAEKSGAPEEILSVFDEVLAELQAIATNPMGVLQEKGVSLEDISKPWQPDPEVCFGSGWGPPGPMPPMEGGGGFGGGPGFGPPPGMFENFGGLENIDPEMMEKMKEKFMEMQKGEGNFQGFNPFGASVLALSPPPESEFGDDEFGPPEGGFGFNRKPPEECMPPVQRHLSLNRLRRKLDEARMNMGKQFESMNICKMLDMAKGFLAGGEDEGFGGPPPEVVELVENGVWQEACDSNDTETLAKIKSRLMRLGPPGKGPGPGGKTKSRFGGLIDIDKLVEDKLSEKLGQLFGEENEKTSAQMKALEARVAELQSKFDDASKTILALNERLADMVTKLATTIDLNEKALQAVNSIPKFMDEAVLQSVTATIDTLATKAEEVKAVLPAEADKLVDATINSLVMSPPSSNTLEDISDRFNAIASYASSGAKSAEIVEKAKDELAEVVVLNSADIGNKVAEGIVASSDTANLSDWYAMPALQAKEQGFVAITKDNPNFKPAEPEIGCAAVTRVARIMEKAGELDINENDKAPVAGAPEWCRPFVHALMNEGIAVDKNVDLDAPIDRVGMAVLLHQAIGDRLPDPSSVSDYVTPDMKNLPVDVQNAIAEIRFNGIMDTTDGTNFSPDMDFNRAQNALVSVKTFEAVSAAQENR